MRFLHTSPTASLPPYHILSMSPCWPHSDHTHLLNYHHHPAVPAFDPAPTPYVDVCSPPDPSQFNSGIVPFASPPSMPCYNDTFIGPSCYCSPYHSVGSVNVDYFGIETSLEPSPFKKFCPGLSSAGTSPESHLLPSPVLDFTASPFRASFDYHNPSLLTGSPALPFTSVDYQCSVSATALGSVTESSTASHVEQSRHSSSSSSTSLST